MSEMDQIFNCFAELKGEIVQIHRQLGEVNVQTGQINTTIARMNAQIGQMDAKIAQMDAKINRMDVRMDRMDSRMDRMDSRMDQMDARMDRMDSRMSSLEEKMERGFTEVKQEFDEKLSLAEFGLDAEIQKVYEIALDNQDNIKKISLRQNNYQIDSVARQQIAEITDRMEVVECVVQSHSEAIHSLQDEIA